MSNFFKIVILKEKKEEFYIKDKLSKLSFNYFLYYIESKNEFIRTLKNNSPDLVLSYYRLSWLSCNEIAKIINKTGNTPFVFLIDDLDEKSVLEIIKRGAWNVINKSNGLSLLVTIENVFKLKQERCKLDSVLKTLKQSNKKYLDLYENAPDMYLTINFETAIIIECNNTLIRNTGYKKKEIINKKINSFFPSETIKFIHEIIVPYLIQNNKVENAEIQIIKKNKKVIYGLININANNNEYKRIETIKVVIRDISHRQKQKIALKESEERFKTIFNKSEDPILILESTDNSVPIIKNVNTLFIKKIGVNTREIIGKPINLFQHKVSDKEIIKIENKIKKGYTFHEKINVNLNGNSYYFDTIASLIKIKNKDLILVSLRDVTVKQIAEDKIRKEKLKYEAISEEYHTQNDMLHETVKKLAANKKELTNKLNIINRSPLVFFSWKNDCKIEYVSENTEKLYGYTAEDFKLGKVKYSEIVHPEDLDRVLNDFNDAIENKLKKITHKPYRIITKDNAIKWVKEDTVIIRKNNKVQQYESIISDYTETVKFQKKIEVSRNKYRTILNSNPDLIVITSKSKRIEYLNPAAQNEFGENLVGVYCHKALFGLDGVCEWCVHNKQNVTKKEMKNPNNGNRYFISSSIIKNEDGTKSYMSVYKDITELRKIQSERLRLLRTLEAGLNEIYLFDTDTFNLKYVNKRAINNLGYHKKEILQLTFQNINTELDRHFFNKLFKSLDTKKTKTLRLQTVHIRKNGTKYPVEISLQIINQGSDYVYLCVAYEISEKLKKEETIKKLSIAINQSPVTIIITDIEGSIEFVNPKFEETTGYKFKEIIGKKPRFLKSERQNETFYKKLWKTIRNGEIWEGEFYNKRKDGTYYWEKATISPLKNHFGVITHFIALKEDITEKKIIKEKLINSELHYRKLFEKSVIGMYLTNPSGMFIKANKALSDMLGFSSINELLNVNLEENNEYSPNRTKFKKDIEKKGFVIGFESVWKNKKGKKIFVRESARRYIDKDGKVFYEGTVENITKQKLANIALKEMHNFNNKIIKIGKLGYAIYKENGDCISVNYSYADIIGGTKEKILKQNFNKNENWLNSGLNVKAEKCLKEGESSKIIIEAISSYKKNIWIELNLSRIYKNNKVLLLVIIKDISSFMKAKQRQFQSKVEYLNLIDRANIPIFGVTKSGVINYWNSSIENISGLKSEFIQGKMFQEVFYEDDNAQKNSFINSISEQREIVNSNLNLINKDKKHLKFLFSTTIRRDINDEVNGITCLGQDITEMQNYKIELEKQVEKRTHELIQALKKEKELGDLKSQFVSMASHEFRTPLAAISFASGFVKKYWDKIDEDKRMLKFNKIETQVKHMTNLLEDILTFGKTEARKVKFNPIKINLIDFLANIIEEVQNVYENKHIINLNFDNEQSYIMLDKKIGRNIFVNLLTNAIKFSPNAYPVFVNVKTIKSRIIIEIIDKGIGIHQNELDHIFTPFHRGQNVQTIQGTGLGLAIVKESIDLMKGNIKVESKVGKGTKFTIVLTQII